MRHTDENAIQDLGEEHGTLATPPDAVGDLHAASDTLPPVLTVDELALLLRLNRKTAYEALARGEIPGARRIGRSYRISRDTVLDWLRGQVRVSRKRSST